MTSEDYRYIIIRHPQAAIKSDKTELPTSGRLKQRQAVSRAPGEGWCFSPEHLTYWLTITSVAYTEVSAQSLSPTPDQG